MSSITSSRTHDTTPCTHAKLTFTRELLLAFGSEFISGRNCDGTTGRKLFGEDWGESSGDYGDDD